MPNRLQSSNSDGAPGTRPTQPVATAITALSELSGARLEWVGQPGSQSSEVVVKGVDLRAQGIVTDDLFAALPGARTHGAQFAVDALGRGATAILTDEAGLELIEAADKAPDRSVPVLVHPNPRDVLGEISAEIYGRPSEKMQVVGITGTSGKTTTSYLLEAAIAGAGRKPGLVGTIETRIDGRRVPSALTTPEAPQLHALFAVMAEQGIDTVVMEVSSHALALGRVDGIRFDIGAFTNLSQDHLDFHRDFEEYFQAKARLFDPESTVRAEHAVVCVDDVWGSTDGRVGSDRRERRGDHGLDLDGRGRVDGRRSRGCRGRLADLRVGRAGRTVVASLTSSPRAIQRGQRCAGVDRQLCCGTRPGRGCSSARDRGRPGASSADRPGAELSRRGRLRAQTGSARSRDRHAAQPGSRPSGRGRRCGR